MLDAGADVTISVGGQDKKLSKGASLPAGDFVVKGITLYTPNYSTGKNDPISGADLQRFSGLSGITFLHVGWINLGDEGLKHLLPLTTLEDLRLSGCGLANQGLQTIGQMQQLKGLTIDYCTPRFLGNITSKGFQYLSNLENLEALSVGANAIDDSAMAYLPRLKKLTYIGLYNTGVTDAGLAHFYGLPQLRTIKIDNSKITRDGLNAFWAKHKELNAGGTSAANTPPPAIAPFNEAQAKAHQQAMGKLPRPTG